MALATALATALSLLLFITSLTSMHSYPLPTSPNNKYDVIVFGGTPAGFAAALAAKNTSAKRVLLLEPTAHIGGMMTGGIGLRDCEHDEIRQNNSTQRQWGMRNAKFYNVSYPVWQPDNWVGEKTMLEMLEEYGVELRRNTTFVEDSSGIRTALDSFGLRRITAIQLESEGVPGEWLECNYIIDASYEGEVMISSGHVSYTYGRESSSQYNESLGGISRTSIGEFKASIDPFISDRVKIDAMSESAKEHLQLVKWVQPGSDPRSNVGDADDNLMAYSFRACTIRDPDPDKKVPFKEPEGYSREDFRLIERYINSTPASELKLPWGALCYHGYPPYKLGKFDACCGSSPVGIDAVGLAVGYANGTRADRQAIYDQHKYYVQGLMWFWSNDSVVPEKARNEISSYGLCPDEWPENDNFPTQLYVREAARLVGDKVFGQNDRIPYNHPDGCLEDAIAVGSWGLDIHEMERIVVDDDNGMPEVYNEGLTEPNNGGVYFFELPYYILLPRKQELVNLAVPNCPSVSHVAFSAIREEPTLWQLGQAAGTAVGIGLRHGGNVPLHDIELLELQETLVKEQDAFVHWEPRLHCDDKPMNIPSIHDTDCPGFTLDSQRSDTQFQLAQPPLNWSEEGNSLGDEEDLYPLPDATLERNIATVTSCLSSPSCLSFFCRLYCKLFE